MSMIRGFPDKMLERIRQQPSIALLQTMLRRQTEASPSHYLLGNLKVGVIRNCFKGIQQFNLVFG